MYYLHTKIFFVFSKITKKSKQNSKYWQWNCVQLWANIIKSVSKIFQTNKTFFKTETDPTKLVHKLTIF